MSKDNKFIKGIIKTLLFILFVIVLVLLSRIINEDIFNHYKLWYCSGDKYFFGKFREFSWGCIAFIKHFREPFILIGISISIIFITISFLIEHANKKN